MKPFIVDAHMHTGYPGVLFSPEVDAAAYLTRMDGMNVQYAVNLGSNRNLRESCVAEMERAQKEYETSDGRLFFLGFFDPRRAREDLRVLRKATAMSGFKGIKIHPSFSGVPADDMRYDAVWRFASDLSLPIVTHSWSASSYNPVQVLSTPDRFRVHVERHPEVRFVLAHSGDRGDGRMEAIRMAKECENTFMDFAGDIYCNRYFETMMREGILDKVLYGSDYPWIDPRSHLTRIYLARIPTASKRQVFRDNALRVFGLEDKSERS